MIDSHYFLTIHKEVIIKDSIALAKGTKVPKEKNVLRKKSLFHIHCSYLLISHLTLYSSRNAYMIFKNLELFFVKNKNFYCCH